MIEDSLARISRLSAPVAFADRPPSMPGSAIPENLYRRLPHPAALIGRVIVYGRTAGSIAKATRPVAAAVNGLGGLLHGACVAAFLLGLALQDLAARPALGWLGSPGHEHVARPESLYRHVGDVAQASASPASRAGRIAAARIVGPRSHHLDEAGMSAAPPSNRWPRTSPTGGGAGVLGRCSGLPGLPAKAINTADSMIGHKTPRHQQFGWAAARLDDLGTCRPRASPACWPPALILPGANAAGSLRPCAATPATTAPPNAGWPEVAMAGCASPSTGRLYAAYRSTMAG